MFIGGEVKVPGRYTLEGPTTVMQAIAMAGGWNIGGNVRQVVIFRRDENWCLKATKIDVRAPLYGKDPCPVNDVWLRENDLVLVPKSRILCATDVINLYFTRGVYAVFPINYVYDFSQEQRNRAGAVVERRTRDVHSFGRGQHQAARCRRMADCSLTVSSRS